MSRTNRAVIMAVCFAGFLAAAKQSGTVEVMTIAATLAVLAVADLRSNKGRALVAETLWLSLFALNIGHDSGNALYLALDLLWLVAGTAVIYWLLRRSETSRALRTHSSLPSKS